MTIVHRNMGIESAGLPRNFGLFAHVEGYSTRASGDQSHSEGNYTQALGTSSHAEGANSTANGTVSHAEGQSTTANGSYSHAEGFSTRAESLYAHAGGYQSRADAVGAWARSSANPTLFGMSRAQTAVYTAGIQTSSTTSGNLAFDGIGTGFLTFPMYSAYHIRSSVVSRRLNVNICQSWTHEMLVTRSSGNAALTATPNQISTQVTGSAMGSVAYSIDTTNQSLLITVAGNTGGATNGWWATLWVTELATPS